MIRRIAAHEWRDLVHDGRFRWASVLIGSLLVVSLLSGWSYHRAVSAEHASAADTSRETWLAQTAKDPHTAAHYGAYVFKPQGPLALVDPGVNAYAGVAAWLEAHKQNEFQFRPAQDRSSIARLGQFTAAATLQGLVPIVVILLGFTKFASEREDGTLRQLAATGVAPRLLAAGKVLGVMGALSVMLVPAALIGSAALVWSAGAANLTDTGARLLALTAAYLVYFAVFLGVTVAASAFARRASHALALLLAFWAVNVVLAPRVASDLARMQHPVPTAFEFVRAVQHDTYDGLPVHEYNVRRAADLRTRLLTQYGVSRIEDLPVNFRGIDYLEREAHSNEVWDRHYSGLWTAMEAQNRLHQAGGLIAPFLAIRAASMALSGADFFHHQHFARAAEAYRRDMVLAMNHDLAYSGSSARRGAYTAAASLWETVPPFSYAAPGLSWVASHVRVALLGLTLWALVAIALLGFSLRRLEVQ